MASGVGLTLDIASKCILVTLLIITTGPLTLRLAKIALNSWLTVFVAICKLVANSLPCLSVFSMVHDAVFTKRAPLFGLRSRPNHGRPSSPTPATANDPKNVACLRVLVGVFIMFYALDFVVYMIGTQQQHETYRHVSFNVQIFLSLVYLAKPWLWRRIDLRDVLVKFEKFYQLALKVTQAIIELLNNLPRGQPAVSPAIDQQSRLGERDTPVPAKQPAN